jgi:hypothetical protein
MRMAGLADGEWKMFQQTEVGAEHLHEDQSYRQVVESTSMAKASLLKMIYSCLRCMM